MAPQTALMFVCLAFVALAAATDVQQCPGKSFQNLNENVVLSPCKKPPCRLKKGTNQHITVSFVPDKDLAQVKNHVVADVFGIPLPFLGVDGNSICDKVFLENGDKASCPLKAGTKYMYKDSFPVHSVYPSVAVKVHWSIQENGDDIVCFEVPARIS
ncbi:unnamed protein product [Diatraea saccharalis]|uniref:MD-2-related lipid-recognition domain-containing protein n=1 Tax=Diatraea saccharalis TaxID=40085 RepID=A0A9N9WE75_9NEOP|nr:unnamed protein product [Diatraea saccharalis]